MVTGLGLECRFKFLTALEKLLVYPAKRSRKLRQETQHTVIVMNDAIWFMSANIVT